MEIEEDGHAPLGRLVPARQRRPVGHPELDDLDRRKPLLRRRLERPARLVDEALLEHIEITDGADIARRRSRRSE